MKTFHLAAIHAEIIFKICKQHLCFYPNHLGTPTKKTLLRKITETILSNS